MPSTFVTESRALSRSDGEAITEAHLGASIAFGAAIALLVYVALQLADASGRPIIVERDAIPLFARWRAGAFVGVLAAMASRALSDRRLPKVSAWTAALACAALVVVVVWAP